MLNPHNTITSRLLDDLIQARLSKDDTCALLERLTPGRIDPRLFTELIALLRASCELEAPIDLGPGVLDCCGTGGSGVSHYNTSTTVAFVLAAAGVGVAKFGNRAMSSTSGSFDFLGQLGIPDEIAPEAIEPLFAKTGLVFLFAPQFYPALKTLSDLRRSLGTRTVFNFTGPLLNPVNLSYRLLGVSDAHMQRVIATFLAGEKTLNAAWVVRSGETLDELCPGLTPTVYAVHEDQAQPIPIHWPLQSQQSSSDRHLTPEDNAMIFKELCNGRDRKSPYYHSVCLNAAAGLVLSGKVETIEAGIAQAAELFADGRVAQQWEKTREAYHALAP